MSTLNPESTNAEIIAVGSELLTPDRVDTNSLYLTGHLNTLGVEVKRKSIVGDERPLLASAIRQSLENAQIVILSGGLGPTEDDVTREAVADAIGRGMVLREEIWDALVARFAKLRPGHKIAENNKRQAYIIEGADVMPNDRGTAPGLWISITEGEFAGRVVMLLPGPPRELKGMFEGQCLPRLQALLPAQVICTRFFRVSGMGESDLDQLISPVYKPFLNPATTILAGAGDIQIHLRARAHSEAEAESLLQQVAPKIEEILGDRIYSRDGSDLETVIGRLLREKNATLSVAESMTGGLIAQRVTSVAGASKYFVGGFLVYTDEIKTQLLGVPRAMIQGATAVSSEVAQAMAMGARERTGSDYAIAITGEAGPQSNTGAQVGTVWVGLAGPDGRVEARHFLSFGGDRAAIRTRAANFALDCLRRCL
jgi:nicotinamide-nucleotide amidase